MIQRSLKSENRHSTHFLPEDTASGRTQSRSAAGARVPLWSAAFRPAALRLIVRREPRGHQKLAGPLPGPPAILVSRLRGGRHHCLGRCRSRCGVGTRSLLKSEPSGTSTQPDSTMTLTRSSVTFERRKKCILSIVTRKTPNPSKEQSQGRSGWRWREKDDPYRYGLSDTERRVAWLAFEERLEQVRKVEEEAAYQERKRARDKAW